METTLRYDIVRKQNDQAIIWLEAAADLEAAESRVKELLSFWPGEYQVFDQQTQQLVKALSSAESPADLTAGS
jgi:hypothetical protein